MANRQDYALAARIQKELAGDTFTPQFARLYSQHTRLQNNQPSLSSWRKEEAEYRLNDAVSLIEVGFILLEKDDRQKAQEAFKRAAELVEWLSHSKIFESTFSLSILSSALYQLAGFPSRAATILANEKPDNLATIVLQAFLRSDFTGLIKTISSYWAQFKGCESPDEYLVLEIVRSIAIVLSHIRWGDDQARLKQATSKLKAASSLMCYNNSYFSWVIAKLTAHIAESYENKSMRKSILKLNEVITEDGVKAFERYLRYNHLLNKSLIWPSQESGLNKLLQGKSFVLCTPTGSGKTTVAELAIIKSLFERSEELESNPNPLILYLTPSRALATEVENKLAKVLKSLDVEIVVTGLYGGTDWGPTDAWLTSDSKTVLICTYEKAEALLRFLGPLFVHRISLVVVDEVHGVQFDGAGDMSLAIDSRAFRLESLVTRLLTHVNSDRVKVIGLSAVAADIEQPLAKWLESDDEATPAKTKYRSTRQILGKLEVASNGGFKISYDLLDSNRLYFDERNQQEGPYVIDPIPSDPTPSDWKNGVVETKLRCSLFWAALHLAAKNDETGQHRSVLISITQQIGGFAEDLLNLMESHWTDVELPLFFSEPTDASKKALWEKCLMACEDYFGTFSREYRLLRKGIVVHHGKMPGTMARLLVQLIDQKIVNVVMATSTLSEGVNLPFETVLVPTIRRNGQLMPVREFANLMGRAGRPGVGTEGRTLVILPRATRNSYLHTLYEQLVTQLSTREALPTNNTHSALLALLNLIEQKWREVFPDLEDVDFIEWLEETSPDFDNAHNEDDDETAEEILNKSLDSLDGFLLSALVEIEKLNGSELDATQWEEKLKIIWKKSFAYSAQATTSSLEQILIQRGQALKANIYQDSAERKQIYCTSLPPKAGKAVLDIFEEVIEHLKTGSGYSSWDRSEKFGYVQTLTELLSKHSKFRVKAKVGRSTRIKPIHVLHWWLDPRSAEILPTEKQISDWFSYLSKNYLYKFNWGLGSILALVMNDVHQGELRETKIEHWESTGLPWIVFWLKELITWGTLDPVTAFLLSRGNFTTRAQAELFAANYYVDNSLLMETDTDEIYNARRIRDWANENVERLQSPPVLKIPPTISVTLERDFSKKLSSTFKVIPIAEDHKIRWFDIAGFHMATSKLEFEWSSNMVVNHDFILYPKSKKVVSSQYMDVN